MPMAELFQTYKELGYGGLLFFLGFLFCWHLLRQNKACYEKYEEHLIESNDEMKRLTVQMLGVVERNTAATNSLQKTIIDMYISKLESE